MTPIIQVSKLNFGYNSQVVLEDINFVINKGEYIALTGPNGGGKTTLVRLLLGLIQPTQNSQVQLFGDQINQFQAWHRVGYVPQGLASSGLDFPLTVEELVANNFQPSSKLNPKLALEQVLETVELLEHRTKLLTQLSGGQRQRAFIARSLINNPELLILDEPTAGVDVVSQAKFYEFIAELNHNSRLTIVFVTHDLSSINQWTDRVFCVNRSLVISQSDKSQSHSHSH